MSHSGTYAMDIEYLPIKCYPENRGWVDFKEIGGSKDSPRRDPQNGTGKAFEAGVKSLDSS